MSDVADSSVPIQQEAIQFNQPASEASQFSAGGAINYLLKRATDIGDLKFSMLTETQINALHGFPNPTIWVLADGRDVTGSQYQTVTGNTNVPDLRGTFARGKDNGRGLDPNGDLPLGTYEADQFASHTHSFGLTQRPADNGANPPALGTDAPGVNSGVETTTSAGGNETNPKAVVVNIFIRIN